MIVYTLIAGYWHKIRLQLEAENNGWDFTTVFIALSGVK